MAEGFKTAYGLEWTAGRLVVARCARRGVPQIALAAAADSPEAANALRAAAAEAEKGAAALAVCAPAAQTAVRRLRAPFASVRKAAKVWPALLDVELPFPVESAVCVYGAPRAADGGVAVVAAALRQGDLAAFGEACRAAGFDPTHCDAEALALWAGQVAEAPPARADVSRVLVWLGADHATIVRGRGADFGAVEAGRHRVIGNRSHSGAGGESRKHCKNRPFFHHFSSFTRSTRLSMIDLANIKHVISGHLLAEYRHLLQLLP